MTESMKKAIGETERRRTKQIAHNLEMGITPRGVVKGIRDLIDGVYSDKAGKEAQEREIQRAAFEDMSERDVAKEIKRLEKLMMEHARNLEFENAARVRDQLASLRGTSLRRGGARQRGGFGAKGLMVESLVA
jgi:excinuclease ABC subunit B